MKHYTELPLAKAITYVDGDGEGAPQRTVSSLTLRRATVSDLAHVGIGNPPMSHYAEVIARLVQGLDPDHVRNGPSKNAGLFSRWVVGQYLGTDKGVKVSGMVSDEAITLFEPLTVTKKSGGESKAVEVTTLKMREPTLDEVGFVPTESVNFGHYLEIVVNCASGIPEDAVRNCAAENALLFIAWAANFIGAAPETGAI